MNNALYIACTDDDQFPLSSNLLIQHIYPVNTELDIIAQQCFYTNYLSRLIFRYYYINYRIIYAISAF